MSDFPPEGWVCDKSTLYRNPGTDGNECNAELHTNSPETTTPSMPGVGPSMLCWQVAGPGAPDPSDLTSGLCESNEGCSMTLVMQLNIEPTDPNHTPSEHYEWWHGVGTWNDPPTPPVPSDKPTWKVTGTGAAGVTWGPPDDPGRDPDGDSQPYLVIEMTTPECCTSNIVTISATPAQGGPSDAVSIDVILTCTCCSE